MTTSSEFVEVTDTLEDIIELYESRHWTDGLPIVPPTVERVEAMIEATGRAGSDVVAVLAPGQGAATVEKIGINAVMAGCRPEYMPVLVAAVEALADPAFNLQGVQVTTNPVAPLLIVNGPARHELGFNAGYGCFGPGRRANATVGRAVRLILINVGSAVPGEGDMAVAGHPGKYTFCVAEHEEENPWEPLHVERGLPRDSNAVTVVGISGFLNTLQATADALAEAITFSGSNDYRFGGCSLFALNPAQAQALASSGLDKPTLKRQIYERSHKQVRDFARQWLEPRADELSLDDPESRVAVARSADDLMVIVTGAKGAGNHSLVLPSFGNSRPVTRAFTLPR